MILEKKSILDELIFNPHEFSFVKAVDVAIASQNIKLADISKTLMMGFELKSKINFQSKFSDICAVEGVKDNAIELHTNLQGIAGIEGSLPDCYTEDYVTYNRESKAAVSDFFDIFNGKILSLRYLFMKRHDVPSLSTPIEKSLIGKIIFSLSGFEKVNKSNENFQDHLIPEQFKISCQNLFWRSSRSSEGLRCILSSFFEVPVRIEQFSGGFVEVDKSSQTSIGTVKNRFNRLGKDSYLGNKVWDSMKGIDIIIGPLIYEKYMNFLPKISRLDQKVSPLQKMKEIIKTYVSSEIDVRIHVYLDKCDVKETLLNGVKRLNKDAFVFGNHKTKDTYFSEGL